MTAHRDPRRHHRRGFTVLLAVSLAIVNRALNLVLTLVFAAMIGLICLEVFLRNWQGASLAWYDEVGRLLLVWATFLGAAVATRDGTHYCIDFLVKMQSGRARFLSKLITDLAVVLVACVFIVWGVALCRLELNHRLAVTGLSLVWQDAALVAGAALTMVFAMQNLFARKAAEERITLVDGS
jgi:TRAP-type C4-dicarboxylate transport system permease small subunit